MRTFYLTILLIPFVTGCSTKQVEANNQDEQMSLDYDDFPDLKLECKDLFLPAKSQYFVYIYSFSCLHCAHIKEEVLETIKANENLFYLMEYSDEITITTNVRETIGKEKIEEVSILGTPTLLEITNSYIALNIAGEREIIEYLKLLPHNNCWV